MNIGIDVKTLSKRYTGIAIYVHDLIQYFNEMDHETQFFLYSHKDFELDFELHANFHKRIYKALTGSLGIMFSLARQLRKDHIDVFWGTEHCLPIGRQPFKRAVTIHDLAVIHNPKVGTRYNAFLQKMMTLPACRNADQILAISNATAKDVVQCAGVTPEKIKVIYNGDSHYSALQCSYTLQAAREVERKFQITAQNYYLFVGSLEPRKNIPTIIKAYHVYRNGGGTKRLVLAGGLGWKYQSILAQIKESPFARDIVLTGYCSAEEKEYFYRNATALLFPSLCEGFGFPIVESMSVGTPVITANVSSMPEVAGECAFYIDDCMDYKQFAKLMSHVENLDATAMEELKEKCIARAKTFSRRKCAVETLHCFYNMIK